MEQKLRGMLGLAVRARQACFGADACRKLLGSGQCAAVLLDRDTAENTRRKVSQMAEKAGVLLAETPPGLMTEATGRDNRIMALRKGAITEEIIRCLRAGGGMQH